MEKPYKVATTLIVICITILLAIIMLPGSALTVLVGVSDVVCHEQYVRVTIAGNNEVEDIPDYDTFSHSDVKDCPSWEFIKDNQIQPEVHSYSVCGHPVDQYFVARNWYHSGMSPGWYTSFEFNDAASETAFWSYMYDTLGYDNHDRCDWYKTAIFDSRECMTDDDCPVDEWVGDTYCGT